MKELIFIPLVLLLVACEDRGHCWGCTKNTTITYSDGRDTSFVQSYIDCSASEAEEAGVSGSTAETLQGGIKKTTATYTKCVYNPAPAPH